MSYLAGSVGNVQSQYYLDNPNNTSRVGGLPQRRVP